MGTFVTPTSKTRSAQADASPNPLKTLKTAKNIFGKAWKSLAAAFFERQ
jgi:hypothetical protein